MEGLVWNVDTVAHVIDIAVAPVFLLAGISGLLMVLTNRLGRTIDRSRALQASELAVTSSEHRQTIRREKANLVRRMHFNHAAVVMSVVSAMLVCLVVGTLFLGSLYQLNVSTVVASLFIVCMVILSLAFFCFLIEVFIATRVMRDSLVHTASFRETPTSRSTLETGSE